MTIPAIAPPERPGAEPTLAGPAFGLGNGERALPPATTAPDELTVTALAETPAEAAAAATKSPVACAMDEPGAVAEAAAALASDDTTASSAATVGAEAGEAFDDVTRVVMTRPTSVEGEVLISRRRGLCSLSCIKCAARLSKRAARALSIEHEALNVLAADDDDSTIHVAAVESGPTVEVALIRTVDSGTPT